MVSGFFVTMTWMGIYTVLFNLYLLRLGYDLVFVGVTATTMALGYAVFSLPAGALANRWGIRRIMLVGYGIASAALFLLPVSMFMETPLRTVWILVIYSGGVSGVSLYMVNAAVYLMNATDRAERNHAFGVQAALAPLASFSGFLIGGFLPGLFAPMTGGSLDNPDPYGYSLLTASFVLALGIPVLLATKESAASDPDELEAETPGSPDAAVAHTASHAPIGIILFLSVAQLIQGVGEASTITYYNVYLDTDLNVPTHIIGLTASIGRLLAVPAALLTPLLIAHWRKGTLFIRASLGLAVCMLPMAFIPQLWAVALGYIGAMVMNTMWRPPIQVYRMEIVAHRWRAVMNGASNMAMGLAWSSMGLGGAHIAETAGYRTVFLVGAVLTTIGTVMFWFFDRVPRGEFVRSVTPTPIAPSD
jgi:MFS family permease